MKRRQEAAEEEERQRRQAEADAKAAKEAEQEAARRAEQAARDSADAPGSPGSKHDEEAGKSSRDEPLPLTVHSLVWIVVPFTEFTTHPHRHPHRFSRVRCTTEVTRFLYITRTSQSLFHAALHS